MASVSGVSSGNASSIYGNRNVISGLASGMDTESMIENAVSGIKKRISTLGQKRTTWEWKQEAYRSIISKMGSFANKYTSYTSSTNLLSSSFFSKAVITTATGSNASKVSATGKTTSSIKINSVDALATAAQARASGGVLGSLAGSIPNITGTSVDLSAQMDISKLAGSMTLGYGGKSVTIDFSELENFDPTKPEDLVAAINKKLDDQKIVTSSGDSVAASSLINVSLGTDGKISFSDKSSGGNEVYIKDVSGEMKNTLGLGDLSKKDVKGFSVDGKTLSVKADTGEYLAGKTMTFTLDGVTKKITLPTYDATSPTAANDFAASIETELNKAFGDKITVENKGTDPKKDLQLSFTLAKGSTLQVSSPVGEKLGIGASASTYTDMGKTLGDLGALTGMRGDFIAAVGDVVTDDKGVSKDSKGNIVVKLDSDGKFYQTEKDGKTIATGYDMVINGVKIGTYTRETALDKVVADINNNTEAGVNAAYSKITNQFVFTSKETGAGGKVDIASAPNAAGKETNLAAQLFGTIDGTQAANQGTDAKFTMEINGQPAMQVTRSSNTFDIDGMNITLNGKFDSTAVGGGDAVSFTSKSDSEKIVTAIKDMVKDYNEMMKEIKTAYTTMPAEKSKGVKYSPLTDEDRATMSESAIEAYEAKAKEGVVFADSDLSSLYNKMRSIFSSSGADGATLRAMGISTEYSATDGTTVTLDEEALRATLDSNPDVVKDAFTKTKEGGSATDGVMAKLKTQLDNYASTTGATKGLLIEKAGSPLAPTSMLKNTFLDQMTNIDKEIERWEIKLSDSIDRYTRQYSQLEQLIAQMNSQSSSLMGMMGGGG